MSQFTTQIRGQRKNQSKDFPSNVEHFQYQGGGVPVNAFIDYSLSEIYGAYSLRQHVFDSMCWMSKENLYL